MAFRPFPQPIGTRACPRFQVRIEGIPITVLNAPVDVGRDVVSFAIYRTDGPMEVEVRSLQGDLGSVSLHPLAVGRSAQTEGPVARFGLSAGANLEVRTATGSLYLFHVPETEPPTTHVRRFAAGHVYDIGVLELADNETLWIEPGALVRGFPRVSRAENVHIGGGGTLMPPESGFPEEHRSIIFDGCGTVSLSDITMTEPRAWMAVFGNCEDVLVQNLHQIGSVVSSDGIDLVGCRRATVRGGFLRNNDDCVVIKAVDARPWEPSVKTDWAQNVADILVEGVTVANDRAGNALEVGHELRVDEVRDITFRDIDILHCHGHGAPFSINNADRATVHRILFEDIRVEHHYDKLINCRVIESRFGRGTERGHVEDVTYRRIRVMRSPSNKGYTVSVLGGVDADHTVSDVRFEDFQIDGVAVRSLDDLDAYVRHVSDVRFGETESRA